MSTKSNLIIFESSKGYSNKVREYFQGKGISTHIVTKVSDLPELVKELVGPIMLIETPDQKANTQALLKLLIDTPSLHSYPLICVGKDAQEHENYLNDYFRLATALRKPVSNSDLYEAVKYISDVFVFPADKHSQQKTSGAISQPSEVTESKTTAKSAEISTIPATSEEKEAAAQQTEILENLPVHELYGAFHSIPEFFFHQSNDGNMFNRSFNGCEYSLTNDKQKIADKSYLPKDPQAIKIIEEICSKLPKWGDARLHRTAALINMITQVVCQDQALSEKAKSAAFLYNWSIAISNKNLLRKDYLTSKSRILRKDVCSRIKDSAVKIALDLGWADIGNLVAKAGRYIGREEKVGDDDLSLVASTIAAVDMVDRACWHNNFFNPRAAYRLMCMAKSGDLSELHPAVLCCIIKLLSEAIASSTQLLLIPKKLRDNPALIEAAKQTKEREIGDNEKKVAIGDLAPGMRLSRPLIAFDGRQILGEDLILDQDLIWRIWQLSLVRPLNAPLVVSNKETKTNLGETPTPEVEINKVS